jgi:glycerol-3-phosphate cytidylyltransferase
MTVVYTGGTFDLFHEGHVELLEACKRIAGTDGKVIVCVNTDEFIARFKGNPPVQSLRERQRVLKSCKYVDFVITNYGEEDSTKNIDEWNADGRDVIDIVAIGSDWAGRDYYGQMGFTKEWLDERNIILIYIDRRTGQSTTNIKEILKK